MGARVNSIYIMLDDGRCIYNQYFTPSAPPKNLITGMFTALQGFVMEFTGSYPTLLSTDKFTFYFQKRGPITIVLNTSDTLRQPKELNDIGLRFIKMYGNEVEDWKGQDQYFNNFEEELKDLLGVEMTTKRKDPEQPLTAMSLLSLDEKYQKIAKEMITVKEMKSTDLANRLDEEEYNIRLKLEELVTIGYLGRYQIDNDYYYFTQ